MESNRFSYKESGIDIDETDRVKQRMKIAIDTGDPRVYNKVGAFGSAVEGKFDKYAHPLLILKTEEPGSKQKLAFHHGYSSSIAYDLVNHLVNDIAVMGALPLYIQDCIICGKLEPDVVKSFVENLAHACRIQGCCLTGGETSIQPGVVPPGDYIISAFGVGIVDKNEMIDGSRIECGDVLIGVASNGLHTNGYTLVRSILDANPEMLDSKVDGKRFLDVIMQPHKCYLQSLKGLFGSPGVKGLAHITGGGLRDNIKRILPQTVDAIIDLNAVEVLPIFDIIRESGRVSDEDMLRTFNVGIGLMAVVDSNFEQDVVNHLSNNSAPSYVVGKISSGCGEVVFKGTLSWRK